MPDDLSTYDPAGRNIRATVTGTTKYSRRFRRPGGGKTFVRKNRRMNLITCLRLYSETLPVLAARDRCQVNEQSFGAKCLCGHCVHDCDRHARKKGSFYVSDLAGVIKAVPSHTHVHTYVRSYKLTYT